MAVTQNTYTGNGSTVLYSLSFSYLDETDVKVTVNGTLVTNYIFATASSIQFATAPAAGAAIRIYRDTDTDQTKATFFAGSAVRAADLNANFIQTLYSVQEIAFRTLSKLGDTMQGILNMGGFKITNLGTPSADSDSATKAYVDSLYSFDLDVPGLTRWRKTATAGQTVFSGLGESGGTLAYTPYRESVFVNGAFQQRNVDYTADTGTSITFTPALIVGDVVEVHCVNNVAGAISDQSSDIYFTQSGAGAAVRTVDSKLKDVVSVKDFGAVGDGVADDTAAIQAAIDYAEGRTILVPRGVYKLTSTLNLSKSGTNIIGDSSAQGVFTDATELGSVLKWAGGASPMITILVGGGSQAAKAGGSIQKLKIDGGGVATNCLKTESAMAWRFEDLKLTGAVTAAWDMTGSQPYALGFNDFYQCIASNISIVVSGSAIGIYAGPTTITGAETTGEHPAFCEFTCVHVTHQNGTGIFLEEADDCSFTNIGISRVTGGTGDAIILNTAGCHGNHFRCVNVSKSGGTDPKIWALNGSCCNYMELAGIDYNIKPTIDGSSELFYIYLGVNNAAGKAEALLPPIRFANTAFAGGLNYLNHFEQGDWTPGVSFNGSSTGITYSVNFGRYQRVGLTVHLTGRVTLTSKGSSTGTARVTGLPALVGAANDALGTFLPLSGFGAVSSGAPLLQLTAGTSTAIVRIYSGGSGVSALTDAEFTNSSSFLIQASYQLY